MTLTMRDASLHLTAIGAACLCTGVAFHVAVIAEPKVQAQARKEHLTTMFLSRGCKLADVQK
ncbi:MAG: hypothetical protein H7346_21680 [Burkholderiaceae bacterium]|nr:hypothetical protein [Burkholderiaceae bacterium]